MTYVYLEVMLCSLTLVREVSQLFFRVVLEVTLHDDPSVCYNLSIEFPLCSKELLIDPPYLIQMLEGVPSLC